MSWQARQGVVKRLALSWRGGYAEQVAPSSSCFGPWTSLLLEPFRDISSPTIKQQQFISCRTFYQYTAKQSTFLGTAGYLQRQLSSQLVHSEPQGACEALLNSRVQEQIAPFLQQTIQRSRTHWPYEENMPKEEVYGDDQCRVQ